MQPLDVSTLQKGDRIVIFKKGESLLSVPSLFDGDIFEVDRIVGYNVFANPFGINRLDICVEFNAATKRAKRSMNPNKYFASEDYEFKLFSFDVSTRNLIIRNNAKGC